MGLEGKIKQTLPMGGSPDLAVMGGDSIYKSWVRIPATVTRVIYFVIFAL